MLRFPRRGVVRGGGHAGRGGFMPPSPSTALPGDNFHGPSQSEEIPFDMMFATEVFPRTTPEPDDTVLTAALLKRNTEVTPSAEEMQAIQSLVTRVQSIIENIILSPGAFTACQVDEIRHVGSFKQGTILAGYRTVDFVVILKTFPTKEAVEALHTKVADELKQTECVRSSTTPQGFDLSNIQGTVKILITTVLPNMRKLDPAIHLDEKLMHQHWKAIKHTRWVEENANSSTMKVLIRILRDMRNRFDPFKPLLPHILDLLAHFAVTNTMNLQPLPLGAAFRRAISLMSSGLFLPTYAGTSMRGIPLSTEESDNITTAAQTLLLIMSMGGYDAVLGLQHDKDILNTATVWNGVVIRPNLNVNVHIESAVQDIEIDEEPTPTTVTL